MKPKNFDVLYDKAPIDDKIGEQLTPKRWEEVYHWGFGYTRCPYCHDETPFYNPVSNSGSDLENNRRTHCPKCGKRVYSREGWIFNQPPKFER